MQQNNDIFENVKLSIREEIKNNVELARAQFEGGHNYYEDLSNLLNTNEFVNVDFFGSYAHSNGDYGQNKLKGEDKKVFEKPLIFKDAFVAQDDFGKARLLVLAKLVGFVEYAKNTGMNQDDKDFAIHIDDQKTALFNMDFLKRNLNNLFRQFGFSEKEKNAMFDVGDVTPTTFKKQIELMQNKIKTREEYREIQIGKLRKSIDSFNASYEKSTNKVVACEERLNVINHDYKDGKNLKKEDLVVTAKLCQEAKAKSKGFVQWFKRNILNNQESKKWYNISQSTANILNLNGVGEKQLKQHNKENKQKLGLLDFAQSKVIEIEMQDFSSGKVNMEAEQDLNEVRKHIEDPDKNIKIEKSTTVTNEKDLSKNKEIKDPIINDPNKK